MRILHHPAAGVRNVMISRHHHRHNDNSNNIVGKMIEFTLRTPWRALARTRATISESKLAWPRSVYIHIPFCKKRCHYCDFPIETVGSGRSQIATDKMRMYVDMLLLEVQSISKLIKAAGFDSSTHRFSTVYFGGGTPSLLPAIMLEEIIRSVQEHLGQICSDQTEVTLEIDPGTFDRSSIGMWRQLGFNRYSVGVQSLEESHLKRIGRSHNLSDVEASIDFLTAEGEQNWSLDLISGLPYLTVGEWERNLRKAASLSPPHISVYDLQVEQGTFFGRLQEKNQLHLPAEADSAEMYQLASQILQNHGYEHYEISNYAKPGHRSRHNLAYWHRSPYFAFGNGSSSYVLNRRFSRPRSLEDYYKYVQEIEGLVRNAITSPQGVEAVLDKVLGFVNSVEDNILEDLMLRLRLSDGVSLQDLITKYGYPEDFLKVWSHAVALSSKGLTRIQDENRLEFCLTDPKGFLVSNTVISELYEKM